MTTTTATIRVDIETHARLVELSRARHTSLGGRVHDAAEALQRPQSARQVTDELTALSDDPDAWNDDLADASSTSVHDGIG